MDAQLILDRLRRDLRRLDRATLEQLHEIMGRSDRFFFRVSPDRLKLQDLFGLGRLLGCSPQELFSRYASTPELSQPDGSVFFRARGLKSRAEVSHNLETFLEWISKVRIQKSGAVVPFDVAAHLKLLGFELPPSHGLRFAELMFSFYALNGQELLDPVSGRELIASLGVATSLLREANKLEVACELLAHAFELEVQIPDFELRSYLYQQGAEICRAKEWAADRMWCLGEAALAAILNSDFELAERLSREAKSLSSDSTDPEAGYWGHAAEAAHVEGNRDLSCLLQIMGSDRAASPISAGRLDQQLGAQKAFSMAVKRRAPMTLGRWVKLTQVLDVSPSLQLQRLARQGLSFPSPELWFQSLSSSGKERSEEPWQAVLHWLCRLKIVDSVNNHAIFDIPCWTAKSEDEFTNLLGAFELLSQQQPAAINSRDSLRLHGGLVLAAHMLREVGHLDLSRKVIQGAFRVQRLAGPRIEAPQVSYSHRTASMLALELGDVCMALAFIERARITDLNHWNPQGLVLGLYLESVVAEVRQHYETTLILRSACLGANGDVKALPPGLVCLSVARAHLRLGDSLLALEFLKKAEPSPGSEPPYFPDYLWTKAECYSQAGEVALPMELLEQASAGMSKASRVTDWVLVEVEKCRHLIRNGLMGQARTQATKLLPLASKLSANPIGQTAVLQLCRDLLGGTVEASSIQETMHRVRFPNVFRSD